MSLTIADDDAIKYFSTLLERAHAGEEIVLTKAGKPYARLTPLATPRRKLGFLAGHVDASFFEPLPESELQCWEGK
ncbi:MAG: type II toxin-antitoxin system Phd/YefM family antitoxin [Halothiobacillaceae bacterium]